jgi:cytochrome P450
MFLPKGTIIIMNVWGLHNDPVKFPDPQNFDPDRYAGRKLLAFDYAVSADYEDRDHYVYGSGRRLCPGIHLAERNLFIAVAKLLWAFDFEPSRDEKGRPMELDVESETAYTEGLMHGPKDYNCIVKVRSEARRETIMREFTTAEENVFSKFVTKDHRP